MKMVRLLPPDRLVTEHEYPYLARRAGAIVLVGRYFATKLDDSNGDGWSRPDMDTNADWNNRFEKVSSGTVVQIVQD